MKGDVEKRGPRMIAREKHTLDAINQLKDEFPYAATLLIYVMLERCLKLYLLQNRKSLTAKEVDLYNKVGRKNQQLWQCRNLDDAAFIEEFLVHCSLGSLEIIYKVPSKKYSNSRNQVLHSELYLGEQRGVENQSRERANRQYFQTAKEQLIHASERYFHHRIIESQGLLQFES